MFPKLLMVLPACALLLSGCVSTEEAAARRAAEAQAARSSREARCSSFGYQRGTPDYSHCLESMYVQDQQAAAAEAANDEARRERIGRSLRQAGAALQAASPPPPSPAVVHCNTMPMGPGTTTTCF